MERRVHLRAIKSLIVRNKAKINGSWHRIQLKEWIQLEEGILKMTRMGDMTIG
jgi:hypothetical protein